MDILHSIINYKLNGSRYMKYFFFLIIIGFLIPGGGVSAQETFSHLGIEKGLSNNSVNTIFKDKYGFMWFGTDDGLNQYNGYGFKIYRNNLNDTASLINNQVVGLAEDFSGNLWIATKRGASVFHSLAGKFINPSYFPYNSSKAVKIGIEIYAIKKGNGGDILMGTAGQGLLVYDKNLNITRQVPFRPARITYTDYSVRSLSPARDRNWLIISGTGLCSYDYHTGKIRVINTEAGIRNANCMEADSTGNLWIGTDIGLYRYNIITNTFQIYQQKQDQLAAPRVLGLHVDGDKSLLIATDGGGINLLDFKTNKISYIQSKERPGSLTSNAVSAIYKDPQNRIWVGTLRGGINILDEQKNKFITISHSPLDKNSLVSDFVLSFCENFDEKIWIGTDGGGISLWDRKTNNFKNFVHETGNNSSLSSNNITSILRDKDNTIWIATFGGGINRYNPGNSSFTYYPCTNSWNADMNVWKLFRDSQDRIWAGTCLGRGLTYLFNRKTNKFEPYNNDDLNNVIAINEDKSGNLWFGTFNTLVRLDKNGKSKVFKIDYPVRTIFPDKEGTIWIGTQYAGLFKFNEAKENFLSYTESDGLSDNSVLNIEEDGHANLWMSTFDGISKFNYKTHKFNNFYLEDGLQSNQFSYNASLRLNTGELLFGGIKGFNIFNPDNIESGSGFPNLWITGLRVLNTPFTTDAANDQSISEVREITLPYDKAVISFEYAALEYSSPTKIRYAYFLEGLDNKWNDVGSARTGSYSRLQAGTYYLRIKSTNAEGIWNKKETVLRIVVLPPWYRTWWAYAFYLVLAAFFLYHFNKYQSNQVRLKYQVEQATLNAEKEKELNERKLSFFTNISHEFRTPLTLIINPVKELLYSSGKNVDINDLSTVFLNAKRLLSLVDQLLLFRKADHEESDLKIVKLNLVTLGKDVFLCFTSQARLKNIEFIFECESEMIEIYADHEKMEIVLFNILSNAFKFTRQNGKIIFSVSESADRVYIHIKDDGQGIPSEIGSKLFDQFYQVPDKASSAKGFGIGLYLANKFVSAHKGTLDYESSIGIGTDFNITLLKGKAHFGNIKIYDNPDENIFLEREQMDEDAFVTAEETIPAEAGNLDNLVSEQPAILLVDDNESIRNYLKKMFKSSFTIYEAADGAQGLKAAQKYVPDIIISDVTMPVMDGIDLCTQIKADPNLNHIPVILLTSSTSSEIKLKGIECGADDYITKPFESELLMARVTNILKSRNSLQRYFYNEITLQSDNQRISPEYKEFLSKCIAITERHLDDPDFNAKAFAKEAGMSHSALYKKVKSISGRSINEFIRFIRLRKAAELLINSDSRVNEAAFQAGFNNQKYFREQFIKLFEMTPSEFIKKYRKPL